MKLHVTEAYRYYYFIMVGLFHVTTAPPNVAVRCPPGAVCPYCR